MILYRPHGCQDQRSKAKFLQKGSLQIMSQFRGFVRENSGPTVKPICFEIALVIEKFSGTILPCRSGRILSFTFSLGRKSVNKSEKENSDDFRGGLWPLIAYLFQLQPLDAMRLIVVFKIWSLKKKRERREKQKPADHKFREGLGTLIRGEDFRNLLLTECSPAMVSAKISAQ